MIWELKKTNPTNVSLHRCYPISTPSLCCSSCSDRMHSNLMETSAYITGALGCGNSEVFGHFYHEETRTKSLPLSQTESSIYLMMRWLRINICSDPSKRTRVIYSLHTLCHQWQLSWFRRGTKVRHWYGTMHSHHLSALTHLLWHRDVAMPHWQLLFTNKFFPQGRDVYVGSLLLKPCCIWTGNTACLGYLISFLAQKKRQRRWVRCSWEYES